MRVPLSWLREYVDITLPIGTLVERLTIAGLEVGSVHVYGLPRPDKVPCKVEHTGPVWDADKIIIGQVLQVDPHPDATKLTCPLVDLGNGRTKALVTGAPNIKVGDKGQKVVVALTGSVLFDGHSKEKTLKELKPTKIRGVPSDSMVCSQLELGIADDHEGIILLDDDAPVGMPLVEYMGDMVLEIDVLPNMARCLSMLGVAREVAALTGQSLRIPGANVTANGEAITGQVKVEIEEPKLSARYAAILLRGASIGPAPYWMKRRLLYAGMRPISNIVDVTNYIMLESGQPLHAFDYDKLRDRAGGKAPTIIVRSAKQGETLTTLDGQKRDLSADNLVIADTAGPIALAGVMGGQETEVSAQTKNILLESASFNNVSIRRTMKAMNLPSEASVRFSRGVPSESVPFAAQRAAELMRLHGGASVCQGIVDTFPAPPQLRTIDLRQSEIRRLLGVDIAPLEVTRILSALEFKVDPVGEGWKVTAPGHRLDIQEGAADLIEDVARIHGYDRLPSTLLADVLPEQKGNPQLDLENQVRELLVDLGMQEAITNALTIPEREAPLGVTGEYVKLLNPISSERVVMRHSVLASLLEVTETNLRHTSDVRLFEIGRVYLPRAGEKLPDEPLRLALVMTGRRGVEHWQDGTGVKLPALDFYDLKGVIESLVIGLHVPAVAYEIGKVPYLHPGKSASITVEGVVVGAFGELHPHTREACGKELGKRTVLVADIDLDALLKKVPPRHAASPVPQFPAALRDVAVVVDEALPADRVEREIRAGGGDLLKGVQLFDLYRDGSIGNGKKSLAYALTYQALDRTLTDKEVDKAHKKIEDRLKHMLKASIRGKD